MLDALKEEYPDTPPAVLSRLISQALVRLPSYTIHAPRRKVFPTAFYNIAAFYRLLEADLADVSKFSLQNDDTTFLLVCIESASRRLFVAPLRDKKSATVVEAFRQLLDQLPRPISVLRTDKGAEFVNRHFAKLLKQRGIRHTIALQNTKAALVERAIKTLMARVHRYMTFANSGRFVDVLPQIVHAINTTKHSHTGVAPLSFNPETDLYRVWEKTVLSKLGPLDRERKKKFKFALQDRVRLTRAYDPLHKGYAGYHTPEYFTITGRHVGPPRSYDLTDVTGRVLEGRASEYELIRIDDEPDARYPIHKVHQRRKRRGHPPEELVSFRGWPTKHRVWIHADAAT